MRFFRRQPPAAPPRWLIVGLGNPGPEYRSTRHNVGFRVIDLLGQRHRIEVNKSERRALVGYGIMGDDAVGLVKPMTFMNLCGESVGPLARQHSLRPEDVLIITDDMDLPVGRLRIRREGSAGGHNGLKSLIESLGTETFPRLRIGVGRPGGGGTIDHVLGKFDRQEIPLIDEAIEHAADAVEMILADGIDPAMNRFNVRQSQTE